MSQIKQNYKNAKTKEASKISTTLHGSKTSPQKHSYYPKVS